MFKITMPWLDEDIDIHVCRSTDDPPFSRYDDRYHDIDGDGDDDIYSDYDDTDTYTCGQPKKEPDAEFNPENGSLSARGRDAADKLLDLATKHGGEIRRLDLRYSVV